MTFQVWVVYCSEFLSFSRAPSSLLCKEKGRREGLSLEESRLSFEGGHRTGQQGERYPYQPHKSELCKLAIF